jgi:hypothetical protein
VQPPGLSGWLAVVGALSGRIWVSKFVSLGVIRSHAQVKGGTKAANWQEYKDLNEARRGQGSQGSGPPSLPFLRRRL